MNAWVAHRDGDNLRGAALDNDACTLISFERLQLLEKSLIKSDRMPGLIIASGNNDAG